MCHNNDCYSCHVGKKVSTHSLTAAPVLKALFHRINQDSGTVPTCLMTRNVLFLQTDTLFAKQNMKPSGRKT